MFKNKRKIAKFEKVSVEKFQEGLISCNPNSNKYISLDNLKTFYNNIKLPQRATKGSAGYDFYAPYDFTLKPGESIKLPTGIRCKMRNDYVLMIYPRSSLGFKYRLQLNNTVGVVDSDYYFSDNEGQIFAKITNDTNEDKTINIHAGEAFMQGVFMQYGLTIDDNTEGVRNGGFGSTTKR